MKHFDFKERNLISGPHLLGLLLVFTGFFVLVSPAFLSSGSSIEKVLAVGMCSVIIGLLIVLTYKGTLIDFEEKKFKKYSSIAGFKFGDWKPLPLLSKIKLESKTYISRNTPNGISPTLSGRVTEFNTTIYSITSEPIFLFNYSNPKESLKQAKRLAKGLEIDLAFHPLIEE
ncbi:MAG: hypothetical protein HLUCCX10_02365 [Algoriphagus marincola HL-49]|uniref:Uncharacterized protein n=1 Tax=Algoriphagus marincola HL-49 TaxID=1305737 RepID=A0A0P7XR49_9BACT|nr:MAG: hypothetical protein HLUCCX10_02365 [Algoriphagus marincola HL-49]